MIQMLSSALLCTVVLAVPEPPIDNYLPPSNESPAYRQSEYPSSAPPFGLTEVFSDGPGFRATQSVTSTSSSYGSAEDSYPSGPEVFQQSSQSQIRPQPSSLLYNNPSNAESTPPPSLFRSNSQSGASSINTKIPNSLPSSSYGPPRGAYQPSPPSNGPLQDNNLQALNSQPQNYQSPKYHGGSSSERSFQKQELPSGSFMPPQGGSQLGLNLPLSSSQRSLQGSQESRFSSNSYGLTQQGNTQARPLNAIGKSIGAQSSESNNLSSPNNNPPPRGSQQEQSLSSSYRSPNTQQRQRMSPSYGPPNSSPPYAGFQQGPRPSPSYQSSNIPSSFSGNYQQGQITSSSYNPRPSYQEGSRKELLPSLQTALNTPLQAPLSIFNSSNYKAPQDKSLFEGPQQDIFPSDQPLQSLQNDMRPYSSNNQNVNQRDQQNLSKTYVPPLNNDFTQPPISAYQPPSGNQDDYNANTTPSFNSNYQQPNSGSYSDGNSRNNLNNQANQNENINSNTFNNGAELAKYEFSYKVNDQRFGTQFSQSETRNGPSAQGQYNVLLPDGRTQTVEYQADSNGFRPQVKYEGNAAVEGESSSKGNVTPGGNQGHPESRPSSQESSQSGSEQTKYPSGNEDTAGNNFFGADSKTTPYPERKDYVTDEGYPSATDNGNLSVPGQGQVQDETGYRY